MLNDKIGKAYIKTLYTLSNKTEQNYREIHIQKKTRGYRTLYEPSFLLKQVQENILEEMSISSYAKAYHKGISLMDNARVHVRKKKILKLDIKDFFPSITFSMVYNACFSLDYYPKPVGYLLTKLCTYLDFLPQGTKTSAYISNLVIKEFDEKVGEYAKNKNISYTRYSDDLTFSGDFSEKEVISYIKVELKKMGFSLNYQKIVVASKRTRQNVTGIVVNEKMQVVRSYRKKIRLEISYIKKIGIKRHLEKIKSTEKDIEYLRKLRGKINYCLQVNPSDKEMKSYQNWIETYKIG